MILQYRSKVSYHRLARCVSFLARLILKEMRRVSRDTRCLLFLASALEVLILHIHLYPKTILCIRRLYRIVSTSVVDTISFSSAMLVYHVCIINSQAFNIVSYTLAEPFLFQPTLNVLGLVVVCKYMHDKS